MLTYSFENRGHTSLYTALYQNIREDILALRLAPEEKLPSKRSLAKHLGISTITVENAYNQLVAEGYIYSKPKSGYYVCRVSGTKPLRGEGRTVEAPEKGPEVFADFISSRNPGFPYAQWTKFMRQTMSDDEEKLMVRSPSVGMWELRSAISDYLRAFRGMEVSPENIVVGAGTEYLYGLILQLLGRDKVCALEDPGYRKIARIYQAGGVRCCHIPLDDGGVNVTKLEQSGADVLHISPAHHFPTGLVTPISRRYELLSWAARKAGRYIIEDDYDSEFRLQGKPIPPLQSIDVLGRVIYINTFSKSLSSTIRISYMVLPEELMARYHRELSFYSCTVSNFEQLTLARLIRSGGFETHINRMRNYYRGKRDAMIAAIRRHSGEKQVEILEEDSGLHFLLRVETEKADEQLVASAAEQGIAISCLSQYYADETNAVPHTLLVNYAGVEPERMEEAVRRLLLAL